MTSNPRSKPHTAPRDYAYRPPTAVAAGKRALDVLEGALPRKVFARIYKASFAVYRGLARQLYLRRWFVALVRRDRAARRKIEAVYRVMPYSLVGWSGLEATYEVVKAVHASNVQGSIVECGVAEGGSAALMALASADSPTLRHMWLFDSYEGLPDPGERDFRDGRTGMHLRPLRKGSCRGTVEQVSGLLFDDLALDPSYITLVKGWFQDTVTRAAPAVGPVAVLRIDADWYDSVKCCLEGLYDSVVPGGYVIIDDYGTCYGAEQAVDEFLASRNLRVTMIPDKRGGCHFVKPPA